MLAKFFWIWKVGCNLGIFSLRYFNEHYYMCLCECVCTYIAAESWFFFRHPLTNEDFRKMLMTPRGPSSSYSATISQAKREWACKKIVKKETILAAKTYKNSLFRLWYTYIIFSQATSEMSFNLFLTFQPGNWSFWPKTILPYPYQLLAFVDMTFSWPYHPT